MDGLEHLPETIWGDSECIPLFEIFAEDHEPMKPSKIKKLPHKFFFDSQFGPNWKIRLQNFRENDFSAIPVLNANYSNHNILDANDLPESCIRISPVDPPVNTLNQLVNKTSMYLLIDFGYIEAIPNIQFLSYCDSLRQLILGPWKSVIIAGTTFPESMAHVPNGKSFYKRREYSDLFNIFHNRFPNINFGDYTITNPKLLEDFDPVTMSSAAKIKYTTDDGFLIYKGKSIKFHGFSQYHGLAKKLTQDNRYSGESFSWGDKEIKEKSEQNSKTGNMRTWVSIGVNHHICMVLDQLASLP